MSKKNQHDSDCGCGHNSPGGDFESVGRALFLREVQAAAREALAALPDGAALDSLNPAGREIIDRLAELYAKAASASKWSESDIGDFAREMGWVKAVMDLQVASLARERDDSGDLGDYGIDCNKVYDKCMTDSGCKRGGWVCLCCIPCSIKYSRCVLGLPLHGGGGIFAA